MRKKLKDQVEKKPEVWSPPREYGIKIYFPIPAVVKNEGKILLLLFNPIITTTERQIKRRFQMIGMHDEKEQWGENKHYLSLTGSFH